jgi:hypothetical protein
MKEEQKTLETSEKDLSGTEEEKKSKKTNQEKTEKKTTEESNEQNETDNISSVRPEHIAMADDTKDPSGAAQDSGDHSNEDNKKEVGGSDAADDSDSEDDKSSSSSDEGNSGDKEIDQHKDKSDSLVDGDSQSVTFLGLRVYTNTGAPAVVNGQLRHEMATSFAGLAIDDQ